MQTVAGPADVGSAVGGAALGGRDQPPARLKRIQGHMNEMGGQTNVPGGSGPSTLLHKSDSHTLAQKDYKCNHLSVGSLDGKVAVVTGTSRGVGLGIAHELLRAGATVIGCSRTALDALPGVESEPEWLLRSAQLVCDQGDYHAIDTFVQQVTDSYGGIDILVNNAGGTVPSPH